jgi:hypothetical protein
MFFLRTLDRDEAVALEREADAYRGGLTALSDSTRRSPGTRAAATRWDASPLNKASPGRR